jgi:uncharacterized protein YcbX
MAILSAITLYPIKSCAGIDLRAAILTRAGLMTGSTMGSIADREWMVVDGAGHFLTQREHPRMALIAPRLNGPSLTVQAPGTAPFDIALAWPGPLAATPMVQVWDDHVPAFDCGDPAAAWFSQAIGAPCRLVRAASLRAANEAWTGGVACSTRFADAYPVLVIGSASLRDLNDKLVAAGRAALPMDRFRPNLVLDRIEAFDEDVSASFDLGQMLLKPVKPCPRCTIPSIDQATSLIGPDPLDVLRHYRARAEQGGAICFGMNCIVTLGESQQIDVGQHAGVTLAF